MFDPRIFDVSIFDTLRLVLLAKLKVLATLLNETDTVAVKLGVSTEMEVSASVLPTILASITVEEV